MSWTVGNVDPKNFIVIYYRVDGTKQSHYIILGLVVCWVLIAVIRSRRSRRSRGSRGSPHERLAATATRAGLIKLDQATLKATVAKTSKQVSIDGSLVMLQVPQGEYVVDFGTAERGTQTTPTTDMQYRIGSNTKSMTAAVIVLLAQEGKLKLEDPAAQYFSGLPFGRRLRCRCYSTCAVDCTTTMTHRWCQPLCSAIRRLRSLHNDCWRSAWGIHPMLNPIPLTTTVTPTMSCWACWRKRLSRNH